MRSDELVLIVLGRGGIIREDDVVLILDESFELLVLHLVNGHAQGLSEDLRTVARTRRTIVGVSDAIDSFVEVRSVILLVGRSIIIGHADIVGIHLLALLGLTAPRAGASPRRQGFRHLESVGEKEECVRIYSPRFKIRHDWRAQEKSLLVTIGPAFTVFISLDEVGVDHGLADESHVGVPVANTALLLAKPVDRSLAEVAGRHSHGRIEKAHCSVKK